MFINTNPFLFYSKMNQDSRMPYRPLLYASVLVYCLGCASPSPKGTDDHDPNNWGPWIIPGGIPEVQQIETRKLIERERRQSRLRHQVEGDGRCVVPR